MSLIRGGGSSVRFLVGVPPVKSSIKAGYGLEPKAREARVQEVLSLGYEYGIQCLPIEEFHLKMYRINNVYVTGGINFGNSYWTDCSLTVDNPDDYQQLQQVFDDSWQCASEIRPLYRTKPIWLN